jgi:hypothetical protein
MPTRRYDKLITSILLTEDDWRIARYLVRSLGFRSFSALVSHLLHKECMNYEPCRNMMINKEFDAMVLKGRVGGGDHGERYNFR